MQRRSQLLLLPAVPLTLAVLASLWHDQAQSAEPGSSTGALGTLVFSMNLYGSTPSLAWAPDGQHLVFNSAYEYYGHDTEISAHSAALGLYVYSTHDSTVSHIVTQQRFHPVWVDNERIASFCSVYEDCNPGLFITPLAGTETRVRENAMHTMAVDNDTLMYWGGFPDETQWTRLDLVTGATEPNVVAGCSWEPPPGAAQDQCVQQVGDVRVWSAPYGGIEGGPPGMGLFMQRGSEPPMQLDSAPPFIFSDPGTWNCAEEHSGPVAPCLSPNGEQVAYVVQDRTNVVMRIMAIPPPGTGLVVEPPLPTPDPVPITEPPAVPNLPPPGELPQPISP